MSRGSNSRSRYVQLMTWPKDCASTTRGKIEKRRRIQFHTTTQFIRDVNTSLMHGCKKVTCMVGVIGASDTPRIHFSGQLKSGAQLCAAARLEWADLPLFVAHFLATRNVAFTMTELKGAKGNDDGGEELPVPTICESLAAAMTGGRAQ